MLALAQPNPVPARSRNSTGPSAVPFSIAPACAGRDAVTAVPMFGGTGNRNAPRLNSEPLAHIEDGNCRFDVLCRARLHFKPQEKARLLELPRPVSARTWIVSKLSIELAFVYCQIGESFRSFLPACSSLTYSLFHRSFALLALARRL
jgi:hypothetical protein